MNTAPVLDHYCPIYRCRMTSRACLLRQQKARERLRRVAVVLRGAKLGDESAFNHTYRPCLDCEYAAGD